MPEINHNNDISIYQMVQNRLPFFTASDDNETLASHHTMEIMHTLNVCLDKAADEVGQEGNYSVAEQSLIADLVSVSLIQNIGSTALSDDSSAGTFVSKAGAGSAQVEFEQIDQRKGSTNLGYTDLMGRLMKSAINKGLKLGCIVSYTDGVLDVCGICPTPAPFRVYTSS